MRLTAGSPLSVRCPHRSCHAEPGEPCYKRWGRLALKLHPERLARAALDTEPFDIAWCPRCGLHGARDRCHTCGGSVEQIPMRVVRDYAEPSGGLVQCGHPSGCLCEVRKLTLVPCGRSTIELCRAAQKVRDGRWYCGAPTHVFAELLGELKARGIVLAKAEGLEARDGR
jgi:hypothetical protein